MNLFGVGAAEAGLVFVIALIVVGPQRFPEIMRSAGRWYRVARAYSNEVMKDVRSAVDEIEREVKAETDDLKSVGDFADLRTDLREAREGMDEVKRDTQTAAGAPAPRAPSASKPATSKSATPSTGSGPSTKARLTPSEIRAASVRPSVRTGPTKPAEREPDPPASYYEGRDPSTVDPFKAKAARDAAASEVTNGAGETPGAETTPSDDTQSQP
ncbi:MAG: twin-arginine translocase TatA/TatE family subunit [Dehalococcoidia bacterium]